MRPITSVPVLTYGIRATRSTVAASVAAACGFALLYGSVLARLAQDWAYDDNYSHGFFIIPVAVWFAWNDRDRILAQPIRPSLVGLPALAGSVALLLAGLIGAELFAARVAMVGSIAAIVLFLFGWAWLRALAFPIALLLLMIPLPAIIFNRLAFPLQLLGSQFGVLGLSAVGVPVFREGNVIHLSNTTLEVAEACSGIRSLITLLTLAIVYGQLTEPGTARRLQLAIAAVPIAVTANGLRIAGMGIAAHRFGASAADGFFHTFSGWAVFGAAFVLLLGFHRVVRAIAGVADWRDRRATPARRAQRASL
jgi:exosortase